MLPFLPGLQVPEMNGTLSVLVFAPHNSGLVSTVVAGGGSAFDPIAAEVFRPPAIPIDQNRTVINTLKVRFVKGTPDVILLPDSVHDGSLICRVDDGAAGTVTALTYQHGHQGTAGLNGDGVQVVWANTDSGGLYQSQLTMTSLWVNATSGSNQSRVQFLTNAGGSNLLALQLDADPVSNRGTASVPAGDYSDNGNLTARIGGVVYDHYADVPSVGTTETTLFTDTVPGSVLTNDGDKLEAEYAGTVVTSGGTATRQLKVSFGGTVIFDSTALLFTGASSWFVRVRIIRGSSSTARCVVALATQTAPLAEYVTYTKVTSLNFTTTKVLKITGTAAGVGAADADILGTMGMVKFFPAV